MATAVRRDGAFQRLITIVDVAVMKLTSRMRNTGEPLRSSPIRKHEPAGGGRAQRLSVRLSRYQCVTLSVCQSVCCVLLRSGELRMRTIRAAVLTVRLSIDYSRITDKLVVAANVLGGATAVLLAGFVAVATGLN